MSTGSHGRAGAPDVVARILNARTEALARPPEENAPTATAQFLVLAVGRQHVALPVERARELLRPGPMARIPVGGPLVGVRSVRGEILVVADTAELLRWTGAAPLAQRYVAVVDDPRAPVGLLVDAAVDLIGVSVDDLEERGDRGLVSHMTPDGVLVLDVDAVLSDTRLFIDGRSTAPRHDNADNFQAAS